MPPVNMLIKPASSACNMRCSYCFYRDVARNRACEFEGMLSGDMLERLVIEAFQYADGLCSFAFQGGEPTLAGMDFYRRLLALQKKHNTKGLEVRNAIQTNGYLINDEWAAFLAENRFLVGLSLDGPAELHNLNRVDSAGNGTFNRVLGTARLLEKHGAAYNILCVVTGKNARAIEKIYRFFHRHGFHWLQFIPCLEPLGQARGQEKYHLSVEAYGAFLVRLFDLWFEDLQKGEYVSIRHLDNWLAVLLGEPPEVCSMCGQCAVQFVVEGDGGVYPCDFYVLDEWRLGTLGEQSLAQMQDGDTARRFIERSLPVPDACCACRYVSVCRNGCCRDRMEMPSGSFGINYYCKAYYHFFSAREPQLTQAVQLLRRMRAAL